MRAGSNKEDSLTGEMKQSHFAKRQQEAPKASAECDSELKTIWIIITIVILWNILYFFFF